MGSPTASNPRRPPLRSPSHSQIRGYAAIVYLVLELWRGYANSLGAKDSLQFQYPMQTIKTRADTTHREGQVQLHRLTSGVALR